MNQPHADHSATQDLPADPTEQMKSTRRSRAAAAPTKLSFVKRLELLALRCYFLLMKRTVRIHVANDRRDQIRYHSDKQFVYAILHAHQVAAVALSEPHTGALVSRSRDGDLLVPLLQSCGCVPIRGSSGDRRKGGATALTQLIRHCEQGHPAVIAVDGPKGPRGKAQKGAAMLAQKTGIPILPVVLVARRRLLIKSAWDRLQLPLPFCKLDCRFGEPIYASPEADLDTVTQQVEDSLAQLETLVDPAEAACTRDNSPAPKCDHATAQHLPNHQQAA